MMKPFVPESPEASDYSEALSDDDLVLAAEVIVISTKDYAAIYRQRHSLIRRAGRFFVNYWLAEGEKMARNYPASQPETSDIWFYQ